MVYYDRQQLEAIQDDIDAGHEQYVKALEQVSAKADKVLKLTIDSVVNKPNAGPSGDKHDYVSLAPYWWPNPETEDGLPWIRKDGQLNPKTRGVYTDQKRAETFLRGLGSLWLAYTYTSKDQYADHMKVLLDAWLINDQTRMNPNLNFAQGIPGINDGRPFGIIEWSKVSHIVSAMQLLKANNKIDSDFASKVDQWLSQYLNWLLTSELGQQESSKANNHGTWYDYQVIGLMTYLGKEQEAKAHLNISQQRIAEQIAGDGAQPHELGRTKSINYASMNAEGLIKIAFMAEQLGVDLWRFKGEQGQSLSAAVGYFYPYLTGAQQWPHRQIWRTIDKAFVAKTHPMLYVAQAFMPSLNLPASIEAQVDQTISAEYRLLYRPKHVTGAYD
nr:alginate lyase family protein [Neiella litorisoli]